jgi:hypothetical protein
MSTFSSFGQGRKTMPIYRKQQRVEREKKTSKKEARDKSESQSQAGDMKRESEEM